MSQFLSFGGMHGGAIQKVIITSKFFFIINPWALLLFGYFLHSSEKALSDISLRSVHEFFLSSSFEIDLIRYENLKLIIIEKRLQPF